ncbi:LamB/YcsF [Eremomyces bilateralis CBS 781.70]|uniref:LamB/YcsF n=1 Tax=Eremomyces bilateralis CBS 781.70 TaxID=1392243 RepID=A0A6G1FWJ1_9PEZI|nr:LamB/YcsF [Eremomyces bilateralis CBS 781.70]KAF1810056.1 LamB/YcsF [Eremomyces bilateralis CBS 781.70]
MAQYLKKVAINCDMGEAFGRWKLGPDDELVKVIDYANVACGFHAGDPTTMLKTIRLAKEHGVAVGAHPGLQDLLGFGRRKIEIHPDDMYTMILYQVGALKAMLDAEDVPLNHIKPHGELFFYMQRDLAIMDAVLRACAVFKVPIFGAKGTKHQGAMCRKYDLIFVEEAYVDTQYNKDGVLQSVAASNLATVEDVYERTRSVCFEDSVKEKEGSMIRLGFEEQPFLFCIHSDMPTALDNAKACRKSVDEYNIKKAMIADSAVAVIHSEMVDGT